VCAAVSDRTSVAELRAGGEVEGVFACSRKDRLMAKSGSPYLALELRDRTGAIPARVFRDADFVASAFERGDLVRVKGRVERFRDELQVELSRIARAEADADPAEFLPVAYRDLDELEGFLEHLAREVYDPEACALHPRLNSDLLICAAILHDVGKVREFELGAEIALSEAGALVGHLALGQQLVVERAARVQGFPQGKLLALSHCVLAHHGADSLPGRRFRSPEALALYRLNGLDAAVKGALEHGLAA
jgi:3'-5' exoribonuclease